MSPPWAAPPARTPTGYLRGAPCGRRLRTVPHFLCLHGLWEQFTLAAPFPQGHAAIKTRGGSEGAKGSAAHAAPGPAPCAAPPARRPGAGLARPSLREHVVCGGGGGGRGPQRRLGPCSAIMLPIISSEELSLKSRARKWGTPVIVSAVKLTIFFKYGQGPASVAQWLCIAL